MAKIFKGRIIALAILQFIILIITLLPTINTDEDFTGFLESITMLFFFVNMTHEYISFSIITFKLMYYKHRYEFKNHACRMIGLCIANMAALTYGVVGFFSITVTTLCLEINKEYNIVDENGVE